MKALPTAFLVQILHLVKNDRGWGFKHYKGHQFPCIWWKTVQFIFLWAYISMLCLSWLMLHSIKILCNGHFPKDLDSLIYLIEKLLWGLMKLNRHNRHLTNVISFPFSVSIQKLYLQQQPELKSQTENRLMKKICNYSSKRNY